MRMSILAGLVAVALLGIARAADKNGPSASSPDQKTQAVGVGNAIEIFDAATGKTLIKIQAHVGNVTALAYSPDGKMLVSGGMDRTVRVFDAGTGKALCKMMGGAAVVALSVSADGKLLSVREADKTTRVWDLASGKEVRVEK